MDAGWRAVRQTVGTLPWIQLDTQALEALRGALVQPLDVLRQTAEQVAAAKRKLVDLGLNGRGLIAGGTRVLDNGGLEALDVVGKFALALFGSGQRLACLGTFELDTLEALGKIGELLLQISHRAVITRIDGAGLSGGDGLMAGALTLIEVIDGDLRVLANGEQTRGLGTELGESRTLLGKLVDDGQRAELLTQLCKLEVGLLQLDQIGTKTHAKSPCVGTHHCVGSGLTYTCSAGTPIEAQASAKIEQNGCSERSWPKATTPIPLRERSWAR